MRWFIALWMLCISAISWSAENQSAMSGSMVLRVDDREATLKEVLDETENKGGWFATLTAESVDLRIPAAEAKAFMEGLRAKGDLVSRGYSSQDHSPELADLASRLRAREAVLARYMEVLTTARSKAVVSVEREISRVITEIEQIKGRIRVLEDKVAYARVWVGFEFKERRAPSRDGSSSFAWLNSMNVSDLLESFEEGYRSSRSLAEVPTPDGFAAYANPSRFQALSSDNVVFRVRSERNKPEANLAFWKQALHTRMSEAGYHVLAEENLTANGTDGYLLELGAANGEQDQTYLITLFVHGSRLILVEASGEADTFRQRRDTVITAIKGIRM